MKRMGIKRAAGAMAVAAAVALLVSACGKDDSQTTTLAALPAPSNGAGPSQANPTGMRSTSLANQGLSEGHDYKIVSLPGYQATKGKVTVKEFFWYGCPHCFRALPKFEQWMKNNDGNVVFEYTPYPATPAWEVPARFNYALQLQHLSEEDRKAVFEAIHKTGVPPGDKERLIAWAGQNGWNADQLRSDWDSFGVTTQVQRDKHDGDAIGLEGVPAVVVNGKYLVTIENAQNQGMSEADLAVAVQRVEKAIESGKLAP